MFLSDRLLFIQFSGYVTYCLHFTVGFSKIETKNETIAAMNLFKSFTLLLLVSLLYQGHAAVSAHPNGHHCAMDACDYPEDDSDPNFCRQVQMYHRCVKENILSNTVCSRLEKAGAATLVIRLKLDHKECLFSDIADKGVINDRQADTASKVYRKVIN
ncbi:hypothetical protein Btru_020127 [Bulinus truncatus]|nr:hypothetical protein Btru_020127 [Bulinus truncatus]